MQAKPHTFTFLHTHVYNQVYDNHVMKGQTLSKHKNNNKSLTAGGGGGELPPFLFLVHLKSFGSFLHSKQVYFFQVPPPLFSLFLIRWLWEKHQSSKRWPLIPPPPFYNRRRVRSLFHKRKTIEENKRGSNLMLVVIPTKGKSFKLYTCMHVCMYV